MKLARENLHHLWPLYVCGGSCKDDDDDPSIGAKPVKATRDSQALPLVEPFNFHFPLVPSLSFQVYA